MRRYGVYLPAVMLFLFGAAIFIFPGSMRWIVAGFFMASGLLLIHILRTLRGVARTMRERLSDMYVEKMQEEDPQAIAAGRVYVSHIN